MCRKDRRKSGWNPHQRKSKREGPKRNAGSRYRVWTPKPALTYGFGNHRFISGEKGFATITQFLIIQGAIMMTELPQITAVRRILADFESTKPKAKTTLTPAVYLMA